MDLSERLRLSKKITVNKDVIEAPNLTERFTSDDMSALGELVWTGYARDKASRMKWERRNEAAMDLAMQVQKPKTFPWPGASNVVFPLVTIGALQFSARSYSNIIQGTDVVRYRVIAPDPTGILRQRAERVSKHMSWQVLEQDESWEEQHDRLLINLAIVGTNFIKSYYSSAAGYPTGELVMARDLVIDYWAKSVESAARVTQLAPLHRNEIHARILTDTFADIRDEAWYQSAPQQRSYDLTQVHADNRKGEEPPAQDEDAPFMFLEQHRYLDLDQDGYAEPYIVTIESASHKVVRLVARFDREEQIERIDKKILRIHPTQYYTKYGFIPSPDGGLYDLGFGIFLGPINEAVNSCINQLLDNGTLQNSIGGFLGRGFKIRGGVYTMAPWEFKRVDSVGDDIKKNMVMFPERKPSEVMMPLLQLLIEYANRIAGTVDTMVGENPGQNTPASTFQGMQEQGLQIYSMIFKRVWRSMKQEFQRRYELNRVFLRAHQTFGPGQELIKREDYTGSEDLIAPVADPNITSTTLRLQQATAVKQAAMTTPGYDRDEVERAYLAALRVPEPGRFFKGEGKVPGLPNPKAMIEQIKLQGKQLDIQFQTKKLAVEMMEQRRLNQAKIDQLEAQAAKLVAEGNSVQTAQKLEAFKTALSALNDHNTMLNERMKALGGMNGNQGGVGGMAGQSDDAGVSGNDSDVAGVGEGAVGAGGANGAGSAPAGNGAGAAAV